MMVVRAQPWGTIYFSDMSRDIAQGSRTVLLEWEWPLVTFPVPRGILLATGGTPRTRTLASKFSHDSIAV